MGERRSFYAALTCLVSNPVGSEEHLSLPSRSLWPCTSWEAGTVWQLSMQTFPRPWGKTFSHTKIPVGCFILKLLPCAAEKLIWEKKGRLTK